VPHLLLHLPHRLVVCGSVEGVPAQQQQLDQVLGHVASRDVEAADVGGQRVALVDRDDVRHSVARVDHDAGEQALRVQRQHRLDGAVHARKVVLFEHRLDEGLAVLLRIHRRLGQHDLVLRGVDLELLAKGVVVEVAHVLPPLHDPVRDWVRRLQHVPCRSALVANHDVLELDLPHLLLGAEDGPADDRREDVRREVVAREAALDKPGAIVADDRRLAHVTD